MRFIMLIKQKYSGPTTHHSPLTTHHLPEYRPGKILIICAVLFPVLLGMVGLVIDGGRLMAAQRQAQNAADAGARAGALALQQLAGNATQGKILAAAQAVVYKSSATPNNGLPDGSLTVNWPPSVSAYYSGDNNSVEAVIAYPISTYFIQVLGIAKTQTANARAVAQVITESIGADVVILDPKASPGLAVQGTNASLAVSSGILVASMLNGVTTIPVQPGVLINGSHNAAEAGGGSPTPVSAPIMRVSGGVDSISNFDNSPPYSAGPPPSGGVQKLDAGTADPPFDPLINLATPTTANGVNNTQMDLDPQKNKVVGVQVQGNNASGVFKPNTQDPITGAVTLNPGIYSDIKINAGANVTFNPGIYVLRPTGNNQGLTVNGGTVSGNGVMFYITGSDYNPTTGAPDNLDNAGATNSVPVTPNPANNTKFASVTFTGSPTVNLSPANFDTPPQPMLFYQRRWNNQTVMINSSPSLNGIIYAQWSNFSLAGNGTYSFAIVVGSMSVNGEAVVNLPPNDGFTVKQHKVYLVE
jgi:Flp pilus assembly protein TadG